MRAPLDNYDGNNIIMIMDLGQKYDRVDGTSKLARVRF